VCPVASAFCSLSRTAELSDYLFSEVKVHTLSRALHDCKNAHVSFVQPKCHRRRALSTLPDDDARLMCHRKGALQQKLSVGHESCQAACSARQRQVITKLRYCAAASVGHVSAIASIAAAWVKHSIELRVRRHRAILSRVQGQIAGGKAKHSPASAKTVPTPFAWRKPPNYMQTGRLRNSCNCALLRARDGRIAVSSVLQVLVLSPRIKE
jgi:hypothetical protein